MNCCRCGRVPEASTGEPWVLVSGAYWCRGCYRVVWPEVQEMNREPLPELISTWFPAKKPGPDTSPQGPGPGSNTTVST